MSYVLYSFGGSIAVSPPFREQAWPAALGQLTLPLVLFLGDLPRRTPRRLSSCLRTVSACSSSGVLVLYIGGRLAVSPPYYWFPPLIYLACLFREPIRTRTFRYMLLQDPDIPVIMLTDISHTSTASQWVASVIC